MKNKQRNDLKLWENELFVLYNSKTNLTEKKLSTVPKLLKPIHQNSTRELKHSDNFSGSRKKKNFKLSSISSDNGKNFDSHLNKSGLEVLLSNKKLSQKGLLTAEEEKRYALLVQQLTKIHSIEQEALKNGGIRLNDSELAKIFKTDTNNFVKFRSACEEARRRMMDCNIRLVISVAKKIHQNKRGKDIHDLVTVGIDGLTRAVEKFDPNKGYKFSTYAHWWIRQAVDRFVLEQRTIKVPVHLWEILSKIRKAQRALRLKLNREPTHGDVGALLGLDPGRVEHILLAYQDTESLDAHFTD